MKRFILLIAAILFVAVEQTFAQNKIDKFCQVTVVKHIAKKSFGENKSLFSPKDSTILQKLNYVNSLTTETDVLNYMSILGWEFIGSHPGINTTALFLKERLTWLNLSLTAQLLIEFF